MNEVEREKLKQLILNNNKFSTIDSNKIKKEISKVETHNMDKQIEKTLDERYHELLEKIVNESFDTLEKNSNESKEQRDIFRNFFLCFLAIQFGMIAVLVILKGANVLELSDLIITTMIASFFVETLGVVAIMVRFVFNSKQEIEIIKAIQQIAEHYKK